MKDFMVVSVVLCAFVISVHNSPLCRIPRNLHQIYQDLPGENKLPLELNDTSSESEVSCSNSRSKTDFCPSTIVTIVNETLFPSKRSRAICVCRECSDTSLLKNCVHVYEWKQVLKRTGDCENGVYIYRPATIGVSVGCKCERRRIVSNIWERGDI